MTIPGETASIIVMIAVPAALMVLGIVVYIFDRPKSHHKPKVIPK